MQRLSDLVERTRKEILGAIDGNFIHHKEYYKDLPHHGGARYMYTHQVRVGNFKHYEVVFEVASATFSGEKYQQKMILLDLKPLIKDRKSKLTYQDKVRYALNEGDLLVGCNCPAFLYWGYAYITTQLGIVHPENRQAKAPDIRNDLRRGIVCKHLQLALSTIPFWASDITRDVKEQLGKYEL